MCPVLPDGSAGSFRAVSFAPMQNASGMYVRAQVRWEAPTGRPMGVFIACRQLIREGRFSAEDEARYFAIEGWFVENLPFPDFYNDGNSIKAVCWFKTSATEMLERVAPLRNLLARYEVDSDLVYTDAPGEVVYEDDWQVGVI